MTDTANDIRETAKPGQEAGAFAPGPQQVARLEDAVRRYNDVPLAAWGGPARTVAVAAGVALAGLFLLLGLPRAAFAAACLGVESAAVAFVMAGFFRPSPLFAKTREYVAGFGWRTWLKLGAGVALAVVVLWLFGLLWVWVLVTLTAAVIGGAIYFAVDRAVEAQRRPILEAAEELCNELRLGGTDEESLRRLVCKYAGNQWEEFYEELFGYAEKLKARDWWLREQKGQVRPMYAAWREPIIDWLNRRLLARRAAAQRREMQKLEIERLLCEGSAAVPLSPPVAAGVPEQATYHLAPEEAALRRPRTIAPVIPPEVPESGRRKGPPPSLGRVLHGLLNLVLGPTARFLLGVLLLAGWLLWMWQNGLIVQAGEVRSMPDALKVLRAEEAGRLNISGVPDVATRWFNGHGAAVGALLLFVSAFLPNWKAALLMPAAAVVALAGPRLGVPEIEQYTSSQVSMAVGGILGLLGIAAGRRP